MNASVVRLLQCAVHLWLAGYVLLGLPTADLLWGRPLSPPVQGAWAADLLTALPTCGGWTGLLAALALLVLALHGIWREPPRWAALFTALLFAALVQRSWLAATGGHWLMTNVLLWMVLLRSGATGAVAVWASHLAFLAVRLQLSLAYAMAAVNKLSGTSWMEGGALLRVAADPDFGPAVLLEHPTGAAVLGQLVLLIQLVLPVALWVPALRRGSLVAALCFHLATAVWFDIPDMALAFVAVLTIWTSPQEAVALLGAVRSCGRRVGLRTGGE